MSVGAEPLDPTRVLNSKSGNRPVPKCIDAMRGGPVSRILSTPNRIRGWMTIRLGLLLPTGSGCQPGPSGPKLPCRWFRLPDLPARGPYLALLQVGLAMPVRLPVPRWALTPPFHHHSCGQEQTVLCGAFPRVTPAGRYPAPLPCGVRTFLAPGSLRGRGHPALRAQGT